MENTNPEQQKREFKGIWIPKEIYLDNKLNWTDKILLIEIDSLSGNKGCFASNAYFAKFLSVSETIVSKSISKLKKFGYIEQTSFDGRKRTLQSRLELKFKADLNQSSKQDETKFQDSPDEKFKYINTSINTPINTFIIRQFKFSVENSCPKCREEKKKIHELIGQNGTLWCPYCKTIFDKQTLKPIKSKKQTDPRIKELIDYFYNQHLKYRKVKYVVNGAKDGNLIKRILKEFNVNEIKGKIDQFFELDDNWLKETNNFSIGMFSSKINSLNGNKMKVPKEGTPEWYEWKDRENAKKSLIEAGLKEYV